MGQKVHPYGFRLGFNRTWKSRWFERRRYADFLHEDLELREELKKKLHHAGVASVEIEPEVNAVSGRVCAGWAGRSIRVRQACGCSSNEA